MDPRAVKKILVPTDFSELSARSCADRGRLCQACSAPASSWFTSSSSRRTSCRRQSTWRRSRSTWRRSSSAGAERPRRRAGPREGGAASSVETHDAVRARGAGDRRAREEERRGFDRDGNARAQRISARDTGQRSGAGFASLALSGAGRAGEASARADTAATRARSRVTPSPPCPLLAGRPAAHVGGAYDELAHDLSQRSGTVAVNHEHWRAALERGAVQERHHFGLDVVGAVAAQVERVRGVGRVTASMSACGRISITAGRAETR